MARPPGRATATDPPLIQRPHLARYPETPPLDEEAEYAGTETGCLARVHNAPPVAVTLAAGESGSGSSETSSASSAPARRAARPAAMFGP